MSGGGIVFCLILLACRLADLVAFHVPPCASCVSVSALRMSEGPCFLCNEGEDSVHHISNCKVVRAVHNVMMPGTPFEKWLWLGHIRPVLTEEQRTVLAYCTYGAHECRRYHRYHGRHTHTHMQHVVRSILHHITAACAEHRSSLACAVRRRVAGALASPSPQ